MRRRKRAGTSADVYTVVSERQPDVRNLQQVPGTRDRVPQSPSLSPTGLVLDTTARGEKGKRDWGTSGCHDFKEGNETMGWLC